MSEYKDFEEKSVDKAVEKACSELGIAQDQLKYDIISYGSSGIFGLVGSKKAVIRVVLPDSDQEAQSHRTESEEQIDDSGNQDKTATALVEEAFGNSQSESMDLAESPGIDEDTREALIKWVRAFIDQVIALISPDSTLDVHENGQVMRFEIRGGDSARLIGKKGQTLDAIHYLVEKGVYKQFGGSVSIEIDVEGYLEKRRSELASLASRLAEKARQTGKPMVINRINAQDRRVVHLTLRENRNVRTQSVGNGDLRKLLIMPKKKGQAKRTNKSNGE